MTLRTWTILLGFVTTLAATFNAAVPKDAAWLPVWCHALILSLVAAFTALTTALTTYYDTAAKKLIETEACLAKLHALEYANRLSFEEKQKALEDICDNYPAVVEYPLR